jgi:hypothetical protein
MIQRPAASLASVFPIGLIQLTEYRTLKTYKPNPRRSVLPRIVFLGLYMMGSFPALERRSYQKHHIIFAPKPFHDSAWALEEFVAGGV